MISHFDNCLFIHIPKTAGQSVETVFLERAGLDWERREQLLLKPNSNPEKGPPRLAHLTAMEYTELGYLTCEQFDALYKFAVVRNPWSRLVSEYTYQAYPYSFKDFIFKHFPDHDDYVKHHGHHRHVMPQWQFVCDHDGNLVVEDIVKFERLQQDFDRVSEALTGEKIQLPHKNKTAPDGVLSQAKAKFKKLVGTEAPSRAHYSTYFDDETLEWVASYYAKDIELFDYAFEDRR